MSSFFPVYNRSSDALNQKRLSSTLQANQARLSQLQQQIATGKRIGAPSEDPSSALRAIRYQASLESARQYSRNLESNRSYLNSTDSQVRSVNNIISEIRAGSVAWAGSPLGEGEREAAISQLNGFRDQMVGIGNTKYNGRYLFSGSNPSQLPFTVDESRIQYNGNDGQLQGVTSINQVLQNNISAQQVFGGISTDLKGTAELRPTLSESTRLSVLRGGAGVNRGSLEISDGYTTSIVDLSRAETLGDVVRSIEANAPGTREISVEITGERLQIRFTDAVDGQLIVKESSGGTIAADLGLRTGIGTSVQNGVIGQSLSPRLTLTTPLQQTVGSPSVAYLSSPGASNDIVFRSIGNGSQFDGLNVQYVDSSKLQAGPGVSQGSEQVFFEANPRAARAGISFSGFGNDVSVTANNTGSYLNDVQFEIYDAGSIGNTAVAAYDAASKTYSIGVDSANSTTAQSVIDAINAEGTFTAAGDSTDTANGTFNPAATINVADSSQVLADTGNSGGDANTVFVHVNPEKSTAKHVLVALNKNAALTAVYAVEVDSTDGPINSKPGDTPVNAAAKTISSGGSGEDFDFDSGFRINVDGQNHVVSLNDVNTVEDLINAVNAVSTGVYAQINAAGTGINIGVNRSGVTFSIGENGGDSATQLGVRSLTEGTLLSALNYGQGVDSQPGVDFTIHRNDGTSIDIDISRAKTVSDVIDLINEHPDNQDVTTRVLARLAATGNGIGLVDDNPTGSQPISVERAAGSHAANDLGFIPVGENVGYPANAPTHANLDLYYSNIAGTNRSFSLAANEPGSQYNGVELEIVSGAVGDSAVATYDSLNGKIIVQVDTSNTKTSTLIAAINDTGLFRAQLIPNDSDTYNTGSGIVSQTGILGTLAGGDSASAAVPAKALLRPAAPNNLDTAIDLVANQAGTRFNKVAVVFQSGLSGDSASAVYDPTAKRLTVTIDPSSTTSNTIISAITAEGTFGASLNTKVDSTNDGTGVYASVGTVGSTASGAPGVLKARDVNPQENSGIFNTIDRMLAALKDESEAGTTEFRRAASLLEVDIERISNAIADVGSRGQYNDFLIDQNEDLKLDLQETLSNELDLDLVQAISDLTAQQAAVEASLRMLSQTFNVSLMDYL